MKKEQAFLTLIISLVLVFASWSAAKITDNTNCCAIASERAKTTNEHYIEIKQELRDINSYLLNSKK